MRRERTHPGRGLLWCGGAAVAFGAILGPVFGWLVGWRLGPGFYAVCVAVGLVLCVCGYGRSNDWSR